MAHSKAHDLNVLIAWVADRQPDQPQEGELKLIAAYLPDILKDMLQHLETDADTLGKTD